MIWSFQSHGVPRGTFESHAAVRVERVDGAWRFMPVGARNPVGLVFLPGGMVDPRAYGPLARGLAEAGHPVAIVSLPWRLAPTAGAEQKVAGRAREASRAMDPASRWVLAGHSRGAAIATRIIADAPTAYDGLALIATTHPRVDLSDLDIPVFKIGATHDCVARREKSEAAARNLPAGTEWIWIEGGNHAQFGYYGQQLGDCQAVLPREEQQRMLVDILGRALAVIAGGLPRLDGRTQDVREHAGRRHVGARTGPADHEWPLRVTRARDGDQVVAGQQIRGGMRAVDRVETDFRAIAARHAQVRK
jgi:pimeloyl-ACP methyl ester carboxylesterase